jgi:glycosyltransferase involved in cell wall biosynthesis
MGRPTISIAMATCNGERFLQEQLESISAQTLPPDELIITDDCSADRTAEIVEEFAGKASFPVRLFRNSERLGYPGNFLKATSYCAGDLIAFCDQDDVWLSGKLARCESIFKDESILLAVHSGTVVDEHLTPLGWLYPTVDSDAIVGPLSARSWRIDPGFSMVFRASLPMLLRPQRPPESWDLTEEMTHDQWVCFLANVFGKTAYIREPLVLYRRHGAALTNPSQLPIREAARRSSWAGEEEYVRMAKLAGWWASYLDEAALSLQVDQRRSARAGADHYRRAEWGLQLRSTIYRPGEGLWQRLMALLRLLSKGEYGHHSASALRLRSFLKDLSVGVLRLYPPESV